MNFFNNNFAFGDSDIEEPNEIWLERMLGAPEPPSANISPKERAEWLERIRAHFKRSWRLRKALLATTTKEGGTQV